MADVTVVRMPNGRFEENCYLVGDPATREAVLVDPGEEPVRFLAAVRKGGWTLRAVWLTHGHLDHVLGVPAVRAASGVPVLLHDADRPLYDAAPQQAAWLLGEQVDALPPPDGALVPGETVRVGGLAFEVRHVPGHSPGSVAFLGHGRAFVGDVLFAGSVGRTDLPGGDGARLLRSIREELLPLADETIVHSGHGPDTTIGRERRTNPFLTGAARLA